VTSQRCRSTASLETALGGPLFDRVNNQLILTDAAGFLLLRPKPCWPNGGAEGPSEFSLGAVAGSPSAPGFARERTIVRSLSCGLRAVPDPTPTLHSWLA